MKSKNAENEKEAPEKIQEKNDVPASESPAVGADDLYAALKAELDKERLSASGYRDDYIRLLAEFENFKKRHEKERERMNVFILANFFKAVIPVIEGFDKAFDGAGEESEYIKGFRMLYRNLFEVFEKFGFRKQKALDEKFDPLHFEAAGQTESDRPEGTVVAVVRDGFAFSDVLIRPAQVIISCGPKKDESGCGGPEAGKG